MIKISIKRTRKKPIIREKVLWADGKVSVVPVEKQYTLNEAL